MVRELLHNNTDQGADGEACGDAGDRASAHIACNATDRCEGSDDECDVFVSGLGQIGGLARSCEYGGEGHEISVESSCIGWR